METFDYIIIKCHSKIFKGVGKKTIKGIKKANPYYA